MERPDGSTSRGSRTFPACSLRRAASVATRPRASPRCTASRTIEPAGRRAASPRPRPGAGAGSGRRRRTRARGREGVDARAHPPGAVAPRARAHAAVAGPPRRRHRSRGRAPRARRADRRHRPRPEPRRRAARAQGSRPHRASPPSSPAGCSSPAAIEYALELVDTGDELGRAPRDRASSAPAQLSSYDRETAQRRLSAYLARRGYTGSTVRAAVDHALAGAHRHKRGTVPLTWGTAQAIR